MKKLIFFAFIYFATSGCNNHPAANSSQNSEAPTDSTDLSFFPVTSFLKGQLYLLDSMPVTVLQVTIANNKTDSSWIQRDKLRSLLLPFIADNIDKKNLTQYFKESKFNDQSTESVTFTYEPKKVLPDSISLRHWDVYVNPEKGVVKRVYLVRRLKQNDQLITQQLTWQTNKWAKMVNIAEKNDGSASVLNETKWIWDFTEDNSSN